MVTDIFPSAPLSALLLIGTVLALVAMLLLAIVAFLGRRRRAATWSAGAALATLLAYSGTLLAFSLASRERVLPVGQEKYFCEIDCHLAYAVGGLETAPALGSGGTFKPRQGAFLIVMLNVRFDESTISPRRDDRPLTPNTRLVRLLDADGTELLPSPEGEAAWRAMHGIDARIGDLREPLRPGEHRVVPLVFDVVPQARPRRLLVTAGEWENGLMIGHESSPLHPKILFRLPSPS